MRLPVDYGLKIFFRAIVQEVEGTLRSFLEGESGDASAHATVTLNHTNLENDPQTLTWMAAESGG